MAKKTQNDTVIAEGVIDAVESDLILAPEDAVPVELPADQPAPVEPSLDVQRIWDTPQPVGPSNYALSLQHIEKRGKMHSVLTELEATDVQDAVNKGLAWLREEHPDSASYHCVTVHRVEPEAAAE